MGCFSYMCKGCTKSVRAGEEAIMYWLEGGVVRKVAWGIQDNYGFCDEMDGDNDAEWGRKVDLHFSTDKRTGFQDWHTKCRKKAGRKAPDTRSNDDPNQGWGDPRPQFKVEQKLPAYMLKVGTKLPPEISRSEAMLRVLLKDGPLVKPKDPHDIWLRDKVQSLVDDLEEERSTSGRR